MSDREPRDDAVVPEARVEPHAHESAALLKAERICSALDEVAGATTEAFGPKGGRDAAMRQGYLGVAYRSGRFVCRYDPARADPQPWRTALSARLGPEEALLVDFVPTVRSTARLAQLLYEVGRRDWHPRAASISLTASIDVEREVVEVNLARDAPPDVVEALRVLGGEYVDVTATGGVVRRSGQRGRLPLGPDSNTLTAAMLTGAGPSARPALPARPARGCRRRRRSPR